MWSTKTQVNILTDFYFGMAKLRQQTWPHYAPMFSLWLRKSSKHNQDTLIWNFTLSGEAYESNMTLCLLWTHVLSVAREITQTQSNNLIEFYLDMAKLRDQTWLHVYYAPMFLLWLENQHWPLTNNFQPSRIFYSRKYVQKGSVFYL